MKRNRKSISYRFRHWIFIRGWEELGAVVFEIITAIAFFLTMLIVPHLLH